MQKSRGDVPFYTMGHIWPSLIFYWNYEKDTHILDTQFFEILA